MEPAPPERELLGAVARESGQVAQSATDQHLSRGRQLGRGPRRSRCQRVCLRGSDRPDRGVRASVELGGETWARLRPRIQWRVVSPHFSCAVWSSPQEPRATAQQASSLAWRDASWCESFSLGDGAPAPASADASQSRSRSDDPEDVPGPRPAAPTTSLGQPEKGEGTEEELVPRLVRSLGRPPAAGPPLWPTRWPTLLFSRNAQEPGSGPRSPARAGSRAVP